MGFFLFGAIFFTALGATLDAKVPEVHAVVQKHIVDADHTPLVVNDGVQKR